MERNYERWLPGSTEQERFAAIAELLGTKNAMFLDIETTGLSRLYESVYLVGILYADGDGPVLEQLLADDRMEEDELLEAAFDRLKEADLVITYNGESFDLPFMRERARKLRLDCIPDFVADGRSLDLFRLYRGYQHFFGWRDCKLKTVEQFVGVERRDEFSGAELIAVYEEYARTQDENLQHSLLLHNFEDVKNLPALFAPELFLEKLRNARVEGGAFEHGDLVLSLSEPAERSLTLNGTYLIETVAGDRRVTLSAPLTEDVLRYYLDNYKDYYFLPESSELVHKSLADGIPSSEKRKAAREECYLSKGGVFFPAPAGSLSGMHEYRPCFRRAAREPVYYEINELTRYLAGADRSEALSEFLHRLCPERKFEWKR